MLIGTEEFRTISPVEAQICETQRPRACEAVLAISRLANKANGQGDLQGVISLLKKLPSICMTAGHCRGLRRVNALSTAQESLPCYQLGEKLKQKNILLNVVE
jgi:hypothetical protein